MRNRNHETSKPFVHRVQHAARCGGAGGGNGKWDSHDDVADHAPLAKQTDKPIAGLIRDLKQRGMLESTMVVWATEFGRTPYSQNNLGRDHNPHAFTCWLAGGGVQGGISNGETIFFRVAFKPTATIFQSQPTVSRQGEEIELKARGRHDACVLPRAVPMVEAMTVLVLTDHVLRQRAQNGGFNPAG